MRYLDNKTHIFNSHNLAFAQIPVDITEHFEQKSEATSWNEFYDAILFYPFTACQQLLALNKNRICKQN